MIKLRQISRTFGKGEERTEAVRQVDLDILEGEFVTIMGPSGCGKSTLLSIIGMLDGAWSGEYEFLGEAVHRLKPKHRVALNREYIGYVFQQYHLLDSLTVTENLEVPLTYRKIKSRDRTALVEQALAQFDLTAKRNAYPGALSGGLQQLVGIARAIIASPRVLLADEPTGNLHSAEAREIMELFQRLNREGTTIVQVTHSEENASYGSRTVAMHDGRVPEGGLQP
jgi:putative ABC transport system ATP-binding protein